MVALNSPPAYRLSDIFEGEDLEILLAHNVKTTRSALKIEPHVELAGSHSQRAALSPPATRRGRLATSLDG